MKLSALLNIFQQKSKESQILSEMRNCFYFLESELGFSLVEVVSPFIESDGKTSNRQVFYYRNEKSRLQIEIAGSDVWFDCMLRRFSYGTPALYSDYSNSVSLMTIAMTETDYEHKNYAPVFIGWKKAIQNTADLIKRHKDFFQVEVVEEIDLFDQIRNYAHRNNLLFNDLWKQIEDPFFNQLKKQITPAMEQKGFHLTLENSSLPPFDSTGMVNFVIYEKDKTTIKITQADWRDLTNIYRVIKNGKEVLNWICRNKNHLVKRGINYTIIQLYNYSILADFVRKHTNIYYRRSANAP